MKTAYLYTVYFIKYINTCIMYMYSHFSKSVFWKIDIFAFSKTPKFKTANVLELRLSLRYFNDVWNVSNTSLACVNKRHNPHWQQRLYYALLFSIIYYNLYYIILAYKIFFFNFKLFHSCLPAFFLLFPNIVNAP
jgi:hypothetical protein